jgi:hypothetical protein
VWWRFRWVGFPFSLRLEQGQCNDPDCPPLTTTTSFGLVVFLVQLGRVYTGPFGVCVCEWGADQALPACVPLVLTAPPPSMGGCMLECKRW